MPLFTNKDTDAGKPKFLVTDSNAPVGTRKSDVFGVDATEAAVASAACKGVIHQGFVAKRTKTRYAEGTATASTSTFYEPLVCVAIDSSTDLEDSDFPDS